ncbi:phage/plasmid primase, P4 family [Massilia aquatica]|uniref:SF3 helicase domain-containing protein n=1 Tax=Massilia aquatica TaxID=2609000 RepID=A0ABX0M2L9_9BURK|nr:phage/plasmid primase, P4 family [Massilia aquatica]NHZ38567.1 hypothetical protein [Massilia aquatica]
MYFNSKKEGEIEPQTAPMNNNGANASSTENPACVAQGLLQLHQSMPNGMNFEATKALALECVDDLLEHWLPDGEQRHRQYVALNPTRNDTSLGSFTINIDTGMWSDFSTEDKGGDLVSLVAYVENIRQVDAAEKILQFVSGFTPEACAAVVQRTMTVKNVSPEEFEFIMPIPTTAMRSRPTFFGPDLGTPSHTWEYCDATGAPMFYVNRFNTKRGKQYRPLSCVKDTSGYMMWKHSLPPSPRPAYGLDRMAARPDAPILFTEGEKAADAAQRLFPFFAVVTTLNGAKAPEKTDFTPFAGRTILIAPDDDEPGQAYKDKLIDLLRTAGANVEAVMNLSLLLAGVPEDQKNSGYDLADAEAHGWTAERLSALGSALWIGVMPKDDPLPPLPPTNTETFTTALRISPNNTSKSSKPNATSNDSSTMIASAPKKRTQQEIARAFAQVNHGGHLAAFNGQVVAYAHGSWSPLIEDLHIKQPLLKMMGPEATASSTSSIADLIKIVYAKSPDTFERSTSLICLNNGTLDPIRDELLGHSYDHYLTNKVDITYDAGAECPLWLQTLGEIFSPDTDKAEKIQFLQEFIGYCLIPSTVHTEFLWLVGAGGNGKSLILSIITALIGKANISYAQIENLDKAFVRAELQGKLVNISAEMSASATQSDSYLKAITSGDVIQAERKFKDSFSFRPYCRIIGATNTLPRLLDHSDGFTRRAVIMRFNRQFKDAEKDVNREAKLVQELPGILNWALAGLRNLKVRGDYVKPVSSEVELKEYRINSDPVRQFAEDHLIATAEKAKWTGGYTLYQKFREWSTENGFQHLASNTFANRLQGVGFEKVRISAGSRWNAEYRCPFLQSLPTTPATSSEIANNFIV